MKITDVGLVYTSTTGLEMALENKPVILAASAHYSNLNLVYEPKDIKEYYSLMKKFEKMRSYYLKLCNNHDKYIDISYYLFGSYYYLNNDITNARKWYLNALEINVLS